MQRSRAIWIFIIVLILLVGVILLFAWADDNTEDTDGTNNGQSTQSQPEQVINTPGSLFEKQVSVAGEVQDISTRREFTISEQAIDEEDTSFNFNSDKEE